MTKTFTTEIGGKTVKIAPRLLEAANLLCESHKGFAVIHGYVSRTNVIVPGKVDYTINVGASVAALYERKITALEAVRFADFLSHIPVDSPLGDMPLGELEEVMDARRTMLINSMQKTLLGIRDDAHRQAHDRVYAHVCPGVKLHLDADNEVTAILVQGSVISQREIVPPVRKIVKSGIPVQVSNVLEECLNKRSVDIKTFSLNPENFEKISIGGIVLESSDLVPLADKTRS